MCAKSTPSTEETYLKSIRNTYFLTIFFFVFLKSYQSVVELSFCYFVLNFQRRKPVFADIPIFHSGREQEHFPSMHPTRPPKPILVHSSRLQPADSGEDEHIGGELLFEGCSEV